MKIIYTKHAQEKLARADIKKFKVSASKELPREVKEKFFATSA